MKSRHGGKRKGAGKKKGTRWASTLSKEAAREAVRTLVTQNMKPMVQAQVAHAIGIGHLYTRDKTGKFNKIENQAEIDRLLSEGTEGEQYWIFTKDPSVQAFTDLMNRAIDKPAEQMQEIKLTTDDANIAKLLIGRQRALQRRLPPAASQRALPPVSE